MPERERHRRADAQRNNASILTAASRAFAEHGLGMALADVARDAHVGVGTIFRNFGSKDQLILALLAGRLRELERIATAASAQLGAWIGVREFIVVAAEMCARDRGLLDAIANGAINDERLDDENARALDAIARLVAAAQRERGLPRDIEARDILPVAAGIVYAGKAATAAGAGSERWRQYLDVLVGSLACAGGRSSAASCTHA